eukprot:11184702-Lingulodinium_polyedra.AAC.1
MVGSSAARSTAGSTARCSSGTGSPRGRSPPACSSPEPLDKAAGSLGPEGPARQPASAARNPIAGPGVEAPGRCRADPL